MEKNQFKTISRRNRQRGIDLPAHFSTNLTSPNPRAPSNKANVSSTIRSLFSRALTCKGRVINRIKCRIVWTRSRSVITSRLELVWGGGESTSGGDSSTVKPREESFYFACPHDVFKDTFTCRRDHPFHVIPIPCLCREFDARHPAVHRSFLPLPLNPVFNPFPTPSTSSFSPSLLRSTLEILPSSPLSFSPPPSVLLLFSSRSSFILPRFPFFSLSLSFAVPGNRP